jgi:hypothetical protein
MENDIDAADKYTNIDDAVDQYANIDDDEYSPLGASIFFDTLGFTIDDVMDAGEEEEEQQEKDRNI